jgi:hypothetical protein
LVTGKINKQKGNEKQKPWFTKKCDKKRCDFNKARRNYGLVKNDVAEKKILTQKPKNIDKK